jgi:amino-acid N-acetyltransferase
MLQILEPLEQQGILVRRTSEELERDLGRFFVIEADGNILGTAAIYPFPEERTAELAALAVNPFYRDGGRGERLLKFAEGQAKAAGLDSLFVLSTRTTHWFIERGFAEADVSRLPPKRLSSYNYDRRSKVFLKEL